MAISYVLLLSCIVYIVGAHPPASSNLSSGGAISRPSSKGSVAGPAISYVPPSKEAGRASGPARSANLGVNQVTVSASASTNLSLTKSVVGVAAPAPAPRRAAPKPISSSTVGVGRPIKSGRPAAPYPRSTVQKPIAAGVGPKPLSASVVGSGRPIKGGRPAALAAAPAVPRSTLQKPIVAARPIKSGVSGGVSRSISSSGVSPQRRIVSGSKQSVKEVSVSAVTGPRTVGTKAPY